MTKAKGARERCQQFENGSASLYPALIKALVANKFQTFRLSTVLKEGYKTSFILGLDHAELTWPTGLDWPH